jgi:hypothetical protein
MARVYKRKPDAKHEKVTIPMSASLLGALLTYAEKLGLPKTSAARMLIEAGLKRENRK